MRRFSLLPLAVIVALAGLFIDLPRAGAQESIDFRISKYNCPTDPGDVSPVAGNIPEECDPIAGVAFTVELEDGTEVASCTTDASGLCIVQVPNEATVIVTEDVTTVAAGYTPRENPITTQAVTEFAGALFINLPPTPPTVGVGPGTHAVAVRHELLALLGVVSVLMVAAGLRYRRQPV